MMITDLSFRAEFETFASERGVLLCAGTDEYGDDTVETRDEVTDFIEGGAQIEHEETRNGRRFLEMKRGKKTVILADFGTARLCYVG